MEKKQDHAALAGPEHHRRANKVFQAREAPFAGRIGGNLEFTASSESLLQKQPDAVGIRTAVLANTGLRDRRRQFSTSLILFDSMAFSMPVYGRWR